MSQLQEKIFRAKADLDAVYEAGKQAGGGGDDWVQYATKVQFQNWNLFGKSEFELNIPMVVSHYGQICQETNTVNTIVEHLTVNGANGGRIIEAGMAFASMMQNDVKLTHLTLNCDFSNCTSVSFIFEGRAALEVIDGVPLDFSSCTYLSQIAPASVNLRYIRFAPMSIKASIDFRYNSKLSADSVQSIFDGLATVTNTQTLTLHKEISISESQRTSAENKGWSIVLR